MTDDNNIMNTPTPPPAPAVQPKPRKRRRWGHMLARLTGTVVLIILSMVISVALAVAWLSSEDGRAFLVNEAEKLASNEHMTLDLGSITRLGVRHLDVDAIRIADKDGTALALNDLSLTFDLVRMMTGRVYINEIKTGSITFDHAPDTGPAEKTAAPAQAFTMPAITVEHFSLNNIRLADLGDTADSAINATGQINLSPNLTKTELSVDIKRSSDDTQVAFINARPMDNDGSIELEVQVDDDGTGLLVGLTGLPRIHVDISGAGPANGWQGTAKADMGEVLQIDGALDVNLTEDAARLTLTGKTVAGGFITHGAHKLIWRSASGRTEFTFTGKAQQDGLTMPKLAVEAGITPQHTGGMDARLTALASKVEPALNSELALALNARLRGDKITLDNSYISAAGERINLKGGVDTKAQTLGIDITSKIASLGRIDGRFGGAANAAISISGRYAAPMNIAAKGRIGTDNLMTPWEQATIMLGMAPSLTFKAGLMGEDIKVENITLSGANGKAINAFGKFENGSGAFEISGGLADYVVNAGLLLSSDRIEAEITKLTGPFGAVTGRLAYAGEREAADGHIEWRNNLENALQVDFTKAGQDIEYSGTFSGKSVRDFRLDFRGDATQGETITARLNTLTGTFGVNKMSLKQQAVLRVDDEGTHVAPFALDLNGGEISISGDFGKERFKAALKATALPANMDVFPLLFDGTVEGDIALSGPYTSPGGKATLALKKITLPGNKKDEARYVDGDITVTLGENRADFITKLSGTAGLKFNAEGYLPVSFAPAGIPQDKPLKAVLDASVDMRALTLLLGLDEHRLAGIATLDMQIGGTLAQPSINGAGGLEKGRYDNLVTGTTLRNITTQFTADENRLSLSDLKGTDNNGGSFTGNGAISFASLQNPEYQLNLSAKRLNLVSLDKLGLVVSGDIHTAGDTNKAAVNGQINIDNGEYYVTQSISGDALSDFDVVETGEGLSVQTEDAPPPASGPDVSLDIGLKAEHSIYVRGPDLESEWSADLHLGGTAAEPALKGQIKLVRGQYRLLDTTVMMKKGVIGFTPPVINDPDIDLTGELKGHGETAIINVTGSANEPAVELTSESGLQDDELLAQVLFGKALNELTPMQALRIARLMAYLTGQGGNGFDPLAAIRRAIGVDALSVGMDEEGGATVSVGKYVSDKVYLSVDQGATPESSAVRVEIEVTDEIEVESSTSGNSESTVGVNWKRDY